MIVGLAAVPVLLLLLVLLLVFFIVLVELRILSYAYRKIGINPRYVFLILVLTLIGSHVNIPLFAMPGAAGSTVVTINVGGALIPALLSAYLFLRTGQSGLMIIGTALVAVAVNHLAVVVPGVGVAVPVLIPPFLAAAVALLLAFRRAPPVAYVAGTMGTLIGADLLNLGRVAKLGAPMLSIGGAGTFDGVFLTGILAGLLA